MRIHASGQNNKDWRDDSLASFLVNTIHESRSLHACQQAGICSISWDIVAVVRNTLPHTIYMLQMEET
jgi:hypothetical protein